MILPGILSLLLCCSTQEPGASAVTVAGASAKVPAQAIARVEAEVAPALAAVTPVFGGQPVQPFRVVVHEAGSDLPPLLSALHHEGSPGFAILSRHEIHVMLDEVASNGRGIRPVLVHEFAHELLDQACGRNGRRIPRWFHEGLAQILAGDTYLGASEEMIVWRAAMGRLLPFYELEDRFPTERSALAAAYAQSYSFVSWIAREYGVDAVIDMARAVNEDTSLDLAMVHATGKPTAALHDAWREHLVHGSGAAWRAALAEFFSLSLVLLVPVLALAMIRRMKADRIARDRLIAEEREEAQRRAVAAALAAEGAPPVQGLEPSPDPAN